MIRFELAGQRIGGGSPPLFLPDIGTFFNQDMALAEDMVRRLKDAGALVVKGELLHRLDMVRDDDTHERYVGGDGRLIAERYRDLIARKVLPLASYARLFAVCADLDLPVVLSVYDREGADFARQIGACAVKIASSNIVHRALIEYVAAMPVPMLLDTGKSTLEEIGRAVGWARDAGAERLIVEHSPDPPPAGLDQHHLRMLPTLGTLFDCPVGLSDHHAGEEMLYAAIALGAEIVEKGICPDESPADQDVHHALPIGRLAAVLDRCGEVHAALGDAMRGLPADRLRPIARMGLIARDDLAVGALLSWESVDFAFPTIGIGAEFWGQVRGWRMRRSAVKGAAIEWADIETDASQDTGVPTANS